MKRVHVLVEGQTEETFVRSVLGPYLSTRDVHLTPILVATKRMKSGLKFKGGVNSYRQIRGDLRKLLADSDATAVTTMFDFYGLPKDFPGVSTLPKRAVALQRVQYLEEALRGDLPDRRLVPYFSLHEFEALLFVAPEEIERTLTKRGLANQLASAALAAPEEVNDGEQTHPAARISALAPGYRKALHGPLITQRIGLDALRQACPHFGAWVGRLEALTG